MRRIKKLLIWTGCVLLLLLLGLHILITTRSKELVSKVVYELSGGSYTATTNKVKFHYFPAGITIESLSVQPTADTGKQFFIKSRHIDLRLKSVFSMIVYKKMSVSHLQIDDPEIVVKGDTNHSRVKLRFSQSIAEIQQGLFNTFNLLKVHHATINNGALRIEAEPQPEQHFSVNHVYIDLKNMVLAPDADNDGIPEFDGGVTIALKKPDIHFANPNLQLKLGHLSASNTTHALLIDSMHFAVKRNNQLADSIHLDHIQINKLNWQRFLNEESIELDSVIIETGKTALNFYDPNQPDAVSKKASETQLYMGPTFLIHHLNISDVSYKLTTAEWMKSREDKMTVQFEGDSLWLKNLSITRGKSPAVDVEALHINFSNYTDVNQRKTYRASLGAIEVSNNTLVLRNYKIVALGGGLFSQGNKLVLPELRLQRYSLEDLLLRRLIAEKLTVQHPEVVVDILQKNKSLHQPKTDVNKELQETLAGINQKVSLKEVMVNNASVILKPRNKLNDDIVISGLSINIDGQKALHAHSIPGIMRSVAQFSTQGFRIKSRNMDLVLSEVKMLEDRGLYFGTVQGKFGTNATVDLKGVTLLNKNFTFDVTSETGLHVSDLLVESGTIDIAQAEKNAGDSLAMNLPAVIRADRVNLGNIVFRLHQSGKVGASSTFNIDATNLRLAEGTALWDQLHIQSSNNEARFGDAHFNAGSIWVQQPGGIVFKQAKGSVRLSNAQINFAAPTLALDLNISSTKVPELLIHHISLEQPNIQIDIQHNTKKAGAAAKKTIAKAMHIGSLQLQDANIQVNLFDQNNNQLAQAKTFKGNLGLQNIEVANTAASPLLTIGSIRYFTRQVQADIANKTFHPSSLTLKASNLVAVLNSRVLDMDIDSLLLTDLTHTLPTNTTDTLHIVAGELGIANFHYSNTDSIKWKEILQQKNWWAHQVNLRHHTGAHTLSVQGLQLKHDRQLSFVLDSMQLKQRLSREAFWQKEPYEKDYIYLQTGHATGSNVLWQLEQGRPDISIQKLAIARFLLMPERDKTRPEDTLTYRPLLANQLKKIPVAFALDTLQLSDGKVVYNEIVKQSALLSTITFDRVNGQVLNIKTKNIHEHDSLIIDVSSYLMNQSPLHLLFKQSYTDSLQKFWMRAEMGAMAMPTLNNIMIPHLGLRIKKGYIDSLHLMVQGHKYFAYGHMDLGYRQLAVKYVGWGPKHKSMGHSLKSWMANVVIQNKDDNRVNWLYKERIQKRGQFNFWAKIGLEGMLANMGIKRNKKAHKKYQQQEEVYRFDTGTKK